MPALMHAKKSTDHAAGKQRRPARQHVDQRGGLVDREWNQLRISPAFARSELVKFGALLVADAIRSPSRSSCPSRSWHWKGARNELAAAEKKSDSVLENIAEDIPLRVDPGSADEYRAVDPRVPGSA